MMEGRRITNNDTCILHCTYRCEFLRKRKAPLSRTTVASPSQTDGLLIPGILLWHHRSRHRLVLKSQEIIERRDLITLNLTAFVMSPCFKLNEPSAAHLLFENVNYLAQMLRQYIPSHNVRGSVHDFVLVSQLGVDPTPPQTSVQTPGPGNSTHPL